MLLYSSDHLFWYSRPRGGPSQERWWQAARLRLLDHVSFPGGLSVAVFARWLVNSRVRFSIKMTNAMSHVEYVVHLLCPCAILLPWFSLLSPLLAELRPRHRHRRMTIVLDSRRVLCRLHVDALYT